MRILSLPLLLLLAFLASPVAMRADVVINEIMYHPQSENSAEEYIELHNSGTAAVDVSGWKFTSGVQFTIPAATSIPAGGYLVVAANAAAFSAKYPGVTNFLAGWSGQLSNSSNTITLRNAADVKVDEVDYSDDGDWGERRRQDLPDYGHRGWVWRSDADGFGKSLELINAQFDNSPGQSWAVSTVAQGTPGAVNSVAVADVAPVISDVEHFPLVPNSAEAVTVTCRVRDDHAAPVTVTLHYRNDGTATFSQAQMFDDGAHGDALASDGVFGVVLPAQPNGTIVEFYFTAADGALTRTWPAPARDYTGSFVQRCNCLYQTDDSAYAGAMPIYRMILLAADRTELSNINTNTGTPPFPFNAGETNDQTQSHARFNATFISQDGTGTKLQYLAGPRNRGNGSRSAQPQNLNVQFPNDNKWNGLVSVVLNTQQTPWQLLGSAVFRQAGLPAMDSRAVQVRLNGTNPASGTSAPSYGFYVCNEFQNSDFADHHFPLDSSGNIYRGQRIFEGTTTGGTVIGGATLEKIVPGASETLSLVDLYKLNYRKETNVSEDIWTDLIALTNALAKGHSGAAANDPVTWDADYVTSVQTTADVNQWMRWFAVQAFLDNEETNLSNGDGDDYYIYFGKTDPRSKLLPYDLDTILGRSGTSNVATHGIFRMIDLPGTTTPVPANPFMKHPQFVPIYYAEMKRLLDGVFKPASFDPLVDQVLGSVSPAGPISTIKSFNAARHAHITTLVPLAVSVTASQTTAGAALTVVNGYPQSTAATCKLIGKANAIDARSVKVNGVDASWSAWEAQWTAPSVALTPGVNRILIQAFGATGGEIDRAYHSVWYNDGTETTAPASIAANTTWTAAAGPYRVTAALTIASGATLTIEPGTVVYLNAGTGIDFTVASGGRLIADGTETLPIRFMAAPGTAGWGGIIINGGAGTPESVLRHVFIEGNGDDAIDVNGADVVLDYLEFGNTAVQYLSLDGASFLVSNCIFPTATAAFEPVHGTIGVKAGGRGIIRDCFFGRAQGYNDVFDFTGGNRPSPILQFINNVIVGGDDDALDLDGTDTWVEGNIFMHLHRNGSPDSSSAVSGGNNGSDTSEVTIVGNLFYDVDQALTAKQGNFYTFLNNTVVDQNGRTSDDTVDGFQTAVFNFGDDGTTLGAGAYIEGNVIHSAEALVRNYDSAQMTVTFHNNLLNMPWTGPGSGNTVADALLNDPAIMTPDATNFRYLLPVIRAQFGLDDCSPARGTGPNGTDKGGVRPSGASLSGAPSGTTNQTSATLTVGTLMTGNGIPIAAGKFPEGSGWTHYKWRTDSGAWSAEMPITTPISLTGLTNGQHTVQVVGKNDAGFYQDHADLGRNAHFTSVTWVVDTAFTPPTPQPLVRINEVLANNTETLNFGTAFPDIIELHNAGGATADISGWGLTDNSSLPYKYAVPAGTTIAPGAYLVIYASGSNSVPPPKTGFALKREGDTLTLTRSAAAGGGIADQIQFGYQLSDYSIGRCFDGSWSLCRPTFTAPFTNELAATGPLGAVKINEWLADAVTLNATDFVELINTSTLPVNLGLCYLTDNPSDWPGRFQIRQLTFIPPGSYISFKADDDEGAGPEHLNFKLDALQGEIGLFDPALALIDNVVYGPQRTDVSEGRTPNGTGPIAAFTQPTPGGPNPAVVGTISTSTTNLMLANHGWRYYQSATAEPANDSQARTFIEPAYNDTQAGLGWLPANGDSAQLFYMETATLTNNEGFAKTTALTGYNSTHPYQTYYFRTHFTWNGPLAGVTLTAKMMLDDGAVIYLNGVEATRVRMPTGSVIYSTRSNTNVGDAVVESIDIPAASLVQGDNVLVVSVHQQASSAQSATAGSSDIVWGMKLDATLTTGFATLPIVLNEVLPINATLQNPDSSFAGWIELVNTGSTALDLGDMSLSDNVAQSRKFVFPAGTMLAAGASLVVQCDGALAASATNTGFSLNGGGGFVGLYHTLTNGGGLHDGLNYGRQIADFSLGRSPNATGAWTLCVPTRAALNAAAGLAPLTGVKINEWLAAPASGSDFLELYNTGPQPVPLGGNYLTDDLTNRTKHLIPALSFIGGSGGARWQRWIADADNSGTPEHVNFELNGISGEALGLYTAGGTALDAVSYGPQPTGRSGGRYPDGTSAILVLLPTPGAMNQLPPPVDTDGDGMPDSWEMANGLNPNDSSDAVGDADHDGQNNLAEYVAGTNPQSPNDALRASLVSSGGTPAIRFIAVAGKTYTVQYKTSLADSTWLKLTDVAAEPTTIEIEIQDGTVNPQTQRFYRIITPAQP